MSERRGVLADPAEAPFDLGRLRGFSDAVFGIAATVVVLQLHVPEQGLSNQALLDELRDQWALYFSFGLSFAVIGRYWLVHHRLFGLLESADGALLWLNHLLLMIVVFLPFAAEMLGLFPGYEVALVFYGSVLVTAGAVNLVMWVHATSDHRLVPDSLLDPELRLYRWRAAVPPVVFAAYTLVALVHPPSAVLALLLFIPAHWVVRSLRGDVSYEERRLELESATARDIEASQSEIAFDQAARASSESRSSIARLLTSSSFSSLDRLIGFSDGVYAIAITLLGLQFAPPPGVNSNEDLLEFLVGTYPSQGRGILPLYFSFVLSFVVIAAYWNLHHRYFLVIRAQDGAVRALNLVHLFFIVSLPFTTELMAEYGAVPVAASAYALNLGLAGLSLTLVWWYASHGHRLVDPAIDPADIAWTRRIGLLMPTIFLVSIPLTAVIGDRAWWFWLIGLAVLQFLRTRERVGA
jgi:uncharacterized membrane protein